MRRGPNLFGALAAIAFTAGLLTSAAQAIRPEEILPDKAQEARARALGKELRCLVCQNELIDDSDADLAHDLRVIVRQRIVAGDNDAQVKQYIVARYGNYVLLKPPFDSETYLLWFGPALLLGAGAIAATLFLRRNRRVVAAPTPLTDDEAKRLAALLADGKEVP